MESRATLTHFSKVNYFVGVKGRIQTWICGIRSSGRVFTVTPHLLLKSLAQLMGSGTVSFWAQLEAILWGSPRGWKAGEFSLLSDKG